MAERTFTCGLDAAVALMGGKWRGLILFALQDGPLRFGELRRTVGGISERMLLLQLKELRTPAGAAEGRVLAHGVRPVTQRRHGAAGRLG